MPQTDTQARVLAEQALREQAAGRDAVADRLFAEALAIAPDTVAAVLREHDAAHEPDSRDGPTADRDRVDQHVPDDPPAPPDASSERQ